MMAAILNSTMLNWDTAILDSDTLLPSLRLSAILNSIILDSLKNTLIPLCLWIKLIQSD